MRRYSLVVVGCKTGFCGFAGDLRRKYLRAFDMNWQKMRRVGRDAPDLSAERDRKQSD